MTGQTCQGTATETCAKDAHYTLYENHTGRLYTSTYQSQGIYCLLHANEERDRRNAADTETLAERLIRRDKIRQQIRERRLR